MARTRCQRSARSVSCSTTRTPAKANRSSRVPISPPTFRRHLDDVRDRAMELARDASGRGTAEGIEHYLRTGVTKDRAGSLATFELALERASDPALRRRLRGPKSRSDAFAVEMLGPLGAARPELDAQLLVCLLNGLRLEWLAEGERSAFAKRIPALVQRMSELLFPHD